MLVVSVTDSVTGSVTFRVMISVTDSVMVRFLVMVSVNSIARGRGTLLILTLTQP